LTHTLYQRQQSDQHRVNKWDHMNFTGKQLDILAC